MSKGVDLSYCQSNVSYSKLAKSVDFAIIRAGFGREYTQEDSNFVKHYNGCKAAGIPVGVYWYSYADSPSDAITEARACLKVLGNRKLDLPVYIDCEESAQARLGKNVCTKIVDNFCSTIAKAGYKAGVYANLNWFNNYLSYEILRKKWSIWLAQWTSSPSKKCDIWQYSSDGSVSGVQGRVDVNILYNDGLLKKSSKPATASKPTSGNNAIKAVQSWLNKTYGFKLKVDGIAGNDTKTHLVKALQKELNKQGFASLNVDGDFGPLTRKAAARAILSYGCKGNITKIVQAALICKGYSTGDFDGIFGKSTQSAVKLYQAKRGIAADGIVGSNTYYILFR